MGSENHPMGGWSRADHLSLTRDVDSQEHKGGLVRALFLLRPLYNWCLMRCLFWFCAEKS